MRRQLVMLGVVAVGLTPLVAVPGDSSAAIRVAQQSTTYESVVLDDNPVAYWRLDEQAGAVADDRGPNDIDAIYQGAGLRFGEAPAVADGTSVYLDGSGDFVYVADASTTEAITLAPTEELSVELWFRPDTLPNDGQFHQLARWRWYGWGLRVLNGTIYGDLWEQNGSFPALTTLEGPELVDDRWYHLVMTKDASEVRLYLDGVEVASAPARGPAYYVAIDPDDDCCGSGGGVGFGRDADVGTFYFRGWLDEIAVYDSALSAGRVQQHFAVGTDEPPLPSFVTIDTPVFGEVIDTGDFTVRGRVEQLFTAESLWVTYAVDVSNSTGATTYACGDPNGNGVVGEVLDCEIAAVVALNSSTAAIPGSVVGVRASLVPFAREAVVADVAGADGFQTFVGPDEDLDDEERERTADFIQAVGSLTVGEVGLFAPLSIDSRATSLEAGIEQSFDLLEDKSGRRVVMLVTDHDGTIEPAVLQRGVDAGIEVRPFAITPASDRCESGGALADIAEAFGTRCVYTVDPAGLTAAFNEPPEFIDRVVVTHEDGTPIEATVDALGNFSADIVVSAGINQLVVTAHLADGSTNSVTQPFFAEDRTRIVAMGDSYSAGEGITPYFDVPGPDGGCHQSTRGYPTLLGTDGYQLPGPSDLDLDLVACSGAVLKNLQSTVQIARGEGHVVQAESVERSADLVTFSIGGNDLGFSALVQHCAKQIQCWEDDFVSLTSGRTMSADEFLIARLALFLPEVRAFYETMRVRTADNAAIVAVGYPELFDDGVQLRMPCWEAAGYQRDERQYLNSRARLFGDLFETEARLAGIWFVNPIEAFKQHRVCDGGVNTQSEWLVGIEASKKIAGDASFHPDDTGAEAYARLISEFLNERVAEGVPLTPAGFPRNPGAVGPQGIRSATPSSTAQPSDVQPAIAAIPTQAAGDAPYPTYDPDTVPTLSDLGLTDDEIDEIRAFRFDHADIVGLSAVRGDPVCVSHAVLGEHLLVDGHDFRPGTEVTVSVTASTESDERLAAPRLTADADGAVRASIIVPTDLVGDADGGITALLTVDLRGVDDETAGGRWLSDTVVVDLADSGCTTQLIEAGDVSPDGLAPAPNASATPGVPLPVPLPSLLEAADCFPQDPSSYELVVGTPGDDTIVGSNQSDLILAGDGNDVVVGGNGQDYICGGDGDDHLRGDNGVDELFGGAGDDLLEGGNGKDVLRGGPDDDAADGGNGKDLCVAESTVRCE